MKMFFALTVLFLLTGCALHPSGNFFGSPDHDSAMNAGNAAQDAGNAAMNHQMHHTPMAFP